MTNNRLHRKMPQISSISQVRIDGRSTLYQHENQYFLCHIALKSHQKTLKNPHPGDFGHSCPTLGKTSFSDSDNLPQGGVSYIKNWLCQNPEGLSHLPSLGFMLISAVKK
jgi:hypothetical protein